MKAIMSLLLLSISTIAQINAQTPPVRPGDFNMDGIVNVADALYWGLAHGETGPARNNATTDWTAQSADDWTESINLVNNKYQDGDGNGLIDTFDLQALYMNYDNTHIDTIKGMFDRTNGVWLTYDADTSGSIKMNRYSMRIKEDTLHGIAFTFDYSNFGSAAIDVGIDTSSLWLGSDDVLVEVLQEDEYQLHVAVTRTNQGDVQIGGDVVLNIVVCEDIAALTDQPEVYIKNAEMIRADETRITMDDHYFQTPPPPKPECLTLWNGEKCEYQNGIINHPEARLNQYNQGFCFEGRLYGDDVAAISMGCDNLSDVYNICEEIDTLWFYAKTDLGGIQQTVEFYISDTHGNIGHAIPIDHLDTTYQRIAIPTNVLMDKDCPLEDIAWVHFRKAHNTSDFHIYIDDIYAGYDWARLWRGDGCYYYDGTLNEEEAYNGRYCYERIIEEDDSWHNSGISLWCEDAPYNLTLSDEIQFYVKADKEGKSFNVYLSETSGGNCNEININDYIQGDSLITDYRLVRIPLDAFKSEECELKNVDGIYFYNRDDLDFKFYIDDIHIYSDAVSCEPLAPVIVSTDTPETPDPILTLYPNPVESILNIDIHYPQSTSAEMFIIDLQGQILYQSHTMLTTGNNRLSYTTDQLPAGMYVAQIRDHNGYTTARKFVIMK